MNANEKQNYENILTLLYANKINKTDFCKYIKISRQGFYKKIKKMTNKEHVKMIEQMRKFLEERRWKNGNN